MTRYEFKVLPAPRRAKRLKGLTRGDNRFCATITEFLNENSLEGWEFIGFETMPLEQRRFLFLTYFSECACLIFRREIEPMVLDGSSRREHEEAQEDYSHVAFTRSQGAARAQVVDFVTSGDLQVTEGGAQVVVDDVLADGSRDTPKETSSPRVRVRRPLASL